MINDKLIKLIVDKKFSYIFNGYNPLEVDAFLDEIIKQLDLLNEKNNEKNALINKQEEEIENLKKEIYENNLLINNLKNQEILKTKKPK